MKHDPYAAIRVKDFRFFVSSRFCLTLAIQIQSVVVAWQIYALTNDPLYLGLIGLAEALPSITVSLYAGHVADVVNRKRIVVICIATLLVCSALLLHFTTTFGSHLIGKSVLPIYAVIFVSGIARGFITPALFAFMPQLVAREFYTNAITWNSSLWEVATISGVALGGLLYAYGVTFAYTVDVGLTAFAFIFMLLVQRKDMPTPTLEENIAEKIKAGLRFVYANKVILSAISLDLFAVLFGGAVALLPIFAEEILRVGPSEMGILRAAPSVGALLMALYITHHPIRRNMGRILLWCVAGFGLCMIAFALSRDFWLSLCILVLSGVFDGVSVIIRASLLQTLTPENMKGRVSAVNNIFIGSSNEIGMFESGLAARLLGVVPSVIFGGAMTLVVVGVTAAISKQLRRLQRVE